MSLPQNPLLLLVAGVMALVLLAHLLHRPVSQLRLMAVTFIITLAVLVAIMLAWQALWWIVQRW